MNNFLESKFGFITLLLCVWGMSGPGARMTSAQDENPLLAKSWVRTTNENPFGGGANAADPFATINGQDPNKGQNPAQPNANLLAALKEYRQEIAQLELQNLRLKQMADQCINSEALVAESYQRVIERLLRHSDESSHKIALEALLQVDARIPLTDMIEKRLMELVASEESVGHELALLWLAKHEPAKAIKMGFQLKGPWIPISTSPRNTEVQKALASPAVFDFEATELMEVADEIRDSCRLNVIVDSMVDTTAPVTYKVSGLSLRTALNGLLAAHDLALHVNEDHLEIVPKGLPEPKQTLVFHVRGLLHDELTLDGIEAQVKNMLTEQGLDGQVLAIDRHRFSITAPDSVQHKVAEFLGQLR